MKILLSSYSFGTGRGSEAGVGWNVAAGLARRGHDVTVLTTTEFSTQNHTAIAVEQLGLRLWEWDEGLSDFPRRGTYNRWQKRIGRRLREAVTGEHFDIFHHITFNQYRGIRDVFHADLPYLIGPVGGAEIVPVEFMNGRCLPWGRLWKEVLRNLLRGDALPLIRRCNARSNRGLTLASNAPTANRLNHNFPWRLKRPATICPIIAIAESEINDCVPERADPPYFLFDGGLRPEKGLISALSALSLLWEKGKRIPLRLPGIRPEQRAALAIMVGQCGLPGEAVEPLAFMPREDMLAQMRGAAAFVSTSFRDSGCMALLESVSLGVPSICFDIPSQQWLPDAFADKIPIPSLQDDAARFFTSYRIGTVITRLAESLERAVETVPRPDDWHHHRCDWLRRTMTWDVRLDQIENFYRQVSLTKS